jgi:hypothetical protein
MHIAQVHAPYIVREHGEIEAKLLRPERFYAIVIFASPYLIMRDVWHRRDVK